MTHTLEQTRGILQQIQCGMGPLPPGFDLETLVCQTVSAVAADCVEHVFVLEPPRQFIHVRADVATEPSAGGVRMGWRRVVQLLQAHDKAIQ